jgi:hypothetical protein
MSYPAQLDYPPGNYPSSDLRNDDLYHLDISFDMINWIEEEVLLGKYLIQGNPRNIPVSPPSSILLQHPISPE